MPVERAAGGTSLIDVLDRVLDKGIVIDAWVRVSLVGIDLITVEARIVVASIDTYLKYSEAVGQVATGAEPAIEGKAYEEVIAENAALRAQLRVRVPARRAAGRRRRDAERAAKRNGSAPYTGVRASHGGRAGAGGEADLLAARVRLLEGFVSRDRDRRLRAATRCSGSATCSASASRSACSSRRASRRSSPSARTGSAGDGRLVHRVARRLEQSARHGVHQPRTAPSSAPSHSAADRRRRPSTPFEDAAFHVVPLGVSGFSRRRVRPAAGRRQRRRCRRSCAGSRRSSPEARSDAAPAGAGRRRPQAGARALAALQHHQRGHRPDSPDRHRRPAAHRERARADAVHGVGGGKRRPPRRRAHEQHAAVVGAVEQGDRGDRRGAARAAARQSGRRLGPACSSC